MSKKEKQIIALGVVFGVSFALLSGYPAYQQAKGEPGEKLSLAQRIASTIDIATLGAQMQTKEAGDIISALINSESRDEPPENITVPASSNGKFVKYKPTHILPVQVKNDQELEAMFSVPQSRKFVCGHWSAENPNAVDLLDPQNQEGRAVLAVTNGTFTTRARQDIVGTYDIFLKSSAGDNRCYTYAHLGKIKARFGTVRMGEVIGAIGKSKNGVSGLITPQIPYHLHFEVHNGMCDWGNPEYAAAQVLKSWGIPCP